MSNFTKLSIPEPCHENWAVMHPTEKGKFCDLCRKEVIDFTTWTDEAVIQYFELNPQQTCGRITENQLLRINQILTTHAQKQPNLWRIFAWALSATTLVASGAKAEEKPTAQVVYPLNTPKKAIEHDKLVTTRDTSGHEIIIKGRIISKDDNLPIPGATIILKGTNIGTVTNVEGEYMLPVDTTKVRKPLVLVVSFIGYETKEIPLAHTQSIYNVELSFSYVWMGEVVIIAPSFFPNPFRWIGWKTRLLWRRVF